MARYDALHKARTRERILAIAARLFRQHGYDGVGIDTIMGEAGLTRGGFYAHFASKQALFEAVLGGPADYVERLRLRGGGTPAQLAAGAMAVVRGYLDPANRERIGAGCTMASLSLDAARSTEDARSAFAATVRALADEFVRGLPGGGPDTGNVDARGLLAVVLSVGGIVLSRAVGDDPLAEAITQVAIDATERTLTP
ncbi:MAG: TetR/AcrR family transcriptional regulator [Pseudomonadales bacterium]|nr:TetR/AcrR family transcriptional regulator [Pseudomonadales bacterium]MCP5184005.1 TetR/AcrR family transcriptional regulator [Pseudomonadales bacterium]